MILKNMLITTAWLLLPVYASTPLFGFASAVVENRKGTLVYADPIVDDEPVLDEELTSTLYSEGTLFVDEMDPTEPDTEEVGEELEE